MLIRHRSCSGFTLIEMSVVIVIIGLIVGGVMVGADLVKAAKRQAIISEANKYIMAANSFRNKYDAVPGTFDHATELWGDLGSAWNGPCNAGGTSTTPGQATCNGSGNDILSSNRGAFLFWQHLANAGLIEGQFSGLPNGGAGVVSPGIGMPRSRVLGGNTIWVAWNFPYNTGWTNGNGFTDGTAYLGAASKSNSLMLGSAYDGGDGQLYFSGAALSPIDAYAIDAKIDDGKPATGDIRATGSQWACGDIRADDPNALQMKYTGSADIHCPLIFMDRF